MSSDPPESKREKLHESLFSGVFYDPVVVAGDVLRALLAGLVASVVLYFTLGMVIAAAIGAAMGGEVDNVMFYSYVVSAPTCFLLGSFPTGFIRAGDGGVRSAWSAFLQAPALYVTLFWGGIVLWPEATEASSTTWGVLSSLALMCLWTVASWMGVLWGRASRLRRIRRA